jgi:hypothetical protein
MTVIWNDGTYLTIEARVPILGWFFIRDPNGGRRQGTRFVRALDGTFMRDGGHGQDRFQVPEHSWSVVVVFRVIWRVIVAFGLMITDRIVAGQMLRRFSIVFVRVRDVIGLLRLLLVCFIVLHKLTAV